MSARGGRVPTKAELQAYGLGKLDAARAGAGGELAGVPAEAARSRAAAALAREAPHASEADRRAAAEYVAAIPQAVRRSLLSDRRTLAPSASVDDPASLLRLLPANLP